MPATRALGALALALCAAGGCDGGGMGDDQPPELDLDGDGFSPQEGDCDDARATSHPGAPEWCNGKDDDCDGVVDEDLDQDLDGFTVCQGDCADNDPAAYQGATEAIDGRDNDCDGFVDNHNDQFDDDGDGWSEDQGDCDDLETDDHHGRLINPGAIEVAALDDGTAEGIDNDCDGAIDEVEAPDCETGLDPADPMDYARALGLCDRVALARFEQPTAAPARGIRDHFGATYLPRAGAALVVLSSGLVLDENDAGFVPHEDGGGGGGTSFGDADVHAHPAPGPGVGFCAFPDPPEVNDYAELRLEVQVPTNAQSFSFDFAFMSAEYPEWVCSEFDDTFVAMLSSQAFSGNVSFDSMGHPVSINVGFFTVCPVGSTPGCTGDAELVGTGYQGAVGGGTGWLTTTSPVVPGEKITLRFVIFDEGDHVLDSTVLIDNFRWKLQAIDTPVTEG